MHPAGHILGLVRRHVLHHLERLLPDLRNIVMVVGIAAQGTRAHDFVDGAKALKMFGEYVPVRAQIADVRHFSAHADAARILDRLRGAPAPRTTRQARMP